MKCNGVLNLKIAFSVIVIIDIQLGHDQQLDRPPSHPLLVMDWLFLKNFFVHWYLTHHVVIMNHVIRDFKIKICMYRNLKCIIGVILNNDKTSFCLSPGQLASKLISAPKKPFLSHSLFNRLKTGQSNPLCDLDKFWDIPKINPVQSSSNTNLDLVHICTKLFYHCAKQEINLLKVFQYQSLRCM